MTEDWLTTTEVSHILGVSSTRVRQLAESERLPCTRTRLGRLFLQSDVEAFLAKRLETTWPKS